MKGHPLDLGRVCVFADAKGLEQVPGDSLSLAVKVGGENQLVARFGFLFQEVDLLFALGQNMVARFEIVLDVHHPLFAGQGAHMTVGGQNLVSFTEKFFDGFRLGRRLDDYQCFCHGSL